MLKICEEFILIDCQQKYGDILESCNYFVFFSIKHVIKNLYMYLNIFVLNILPVNWSFSYELRKFAFSVLILYYSKSNVEICKNFLSPEFLSFKNVQ